MSIQTDVSSAHLNASGLCYSARTRLRGIAISGQSAAGTVDIFDTLTPPIAATYGQSGTTITVTKTAHGLVTGDLVGISFFASGGGVSSTDGNYEITKIDANTFTITSLNSQSVASNTNCLYVKAEGGHSSPWVTAMDTSAVTAGGQTISLTIPGEGLVIHVGLYISLTNINSVTVFYG